MRSEIFLIDPTGRKRPMFAAAAAPHREFARENDVIADRLEASPVEVARQVAELYRRVAREHRDCAEREKR